MSYYNQFAGHLAGAVISGTPYANSYSLDYNGTDDYMVIANPNNFRFVSGGADTAFSGGGWVKMDDATRFRFMSKATAATLEWWFIWNPSDVLSIVLWDNSTTRFIQSQLNSASTADQGAWVHFGFTYDGSGTAAGLNIYRNGVAPAQTRSTGAGGYTVMQDSGTNLELGRIAVGPGFADGKIGDVAVWNKGLSGAEVTAWYNGGVPFDLRTHSAAANLILLSNIKNQHPTQPDLSGDSNDGTMTNMSIANVSTDHP